MAKQKGLVTLNGTIGDQNFYTRVGVPLVRAAGGGFTREQILHAPGMAKVRGNMSEFGWCSTTNKVFRQALMPFTVYHNDTTLHNRLMQSLQKIKTLDTISERGKRCVAIGLKDAEGKRLMKGFAFSPKRNALQLLNAAGQFDVATLTYSVTSFSAARAKFPGKGSHAEVLLGVLRFDFDTLAYSLALSEPLHIGRDAVPSTFSLTAPAPTEGPGIRIAFLCVRFYEVSAGQKIAFTGMDKFGLDAVGVFETIDGAS